MRGAWPCRRQVYAGQWKQPVPLRIPWSLLYFWYISAEQLEADISPTPVHHQSCNLIWLMKWHRLLQFRSSPLLTTTTMIKYILIKQQSITAAKYWSNDYCIISNTIMIKYIYTGKSGGYFKEVRIMSPYQARYPVLSTYILGCSHLLLSKVVYNVWSSSARSSGTLKTLYTKRKAGGWS